MDSLDTRTARAAIIVTIAAIAATIALLVPGLPGLRSADGFQGGNDVALTASNAAINPADGHAMVTIAARELAATPSAVRGTIAFNDGVLGFVTCHSLVTWAACTEASPGLIVFETVTDTNWSGTTDLLQIEFDAAGVSNIQNLDLEVEQVLAANTAVLDASSTDSIVAPHEAGDVNCETRSDIVDALLISQYTVGLRTDSGNCLDVDSSTNLYADGGDMNGDGQTTIIDALIIAQCSVGLNNPHCDA